MQCACAILSSVVCPAKQIFFPHYLMIGKIFEIKLLNIKCVRRVSLHLLSLTFFTLTRTERDMIKNVYLYSRKVPFFCQILIKLEFSIQIFEEDSNLKFHENPSCGSRAVLCGQTDGRTDRHDEANCHFSQFCERA